VRVFGRVVETGGQEPGDIENGELRYAVLNLRRCRLNEGYKQDQRVSQVLIT
jgi:hypothetical protein